MPPSAAANQIGSSDQIKPDVSQLKPMVRNASATRTIDTTVGQFGKRHPIAIPTIAPTTAEIAFRVAGRSQKDGCASHMFRAAA